MNGAGADAAGTGKHMADGPLDDCMNPMDVGQRDLRGFVIGMADVVANHPPL